MNSSELIEKFDALEGREKKVLLAGILFVLLFISFNFIYNPMTSSIDKLQSSNVEKKKLLVWMTESAASIKSSPSSGSKASKRRGRSLNEIINSTASSVKISISRSQPRDNSRYQIWIDQVMFNDLLRWLSLLQNDYGVFVSNINLGSTDKKGFVRVNLTFQDSGSS